MQQYHRAGHESNRASPCASRICRTAAAAALHVRAIVVTVAACRMQLHGRMNRKVANFVAHRLIHHHEIHHGM